VEEIILKVEFKKNIRNLDIAKINNKLKNGGNILYYNKEEFKECVDYFWKVYNENHLGMLGRHYYDVLAEMSEAASKYLEIEQNITKLVAQIKEEQKTLKTYITTVTESNLSVEPEKLVKYYFNEGYLEALQLFDLKVSLKNITDKLKEIDGKLG
jgi:hypothetical protein